MRIIIVFLFLIIFSGISTLAHAFPGEYMFNGPKPQKTFTPEPKQRVIGEPSSLYKKIKPANISLENNLDPYEQQDNYDTHRSPYPLIRTTQEIYAQGTAIPPGYYLLTPRKIGAKNYIFFKQKGKVSHIIPIFQIDDVNPEKLYPKAEVPFAKFPWGIRHVMKFVSIMVGKYQRPLDPPQHKVECFPYNDDYYGIDVFYKDKLYRTIYRFKKDDTLL